MQVMKQQQMVDTHLYMRTKKINKHTPSTSFAHKHRGDKIQQSLKVLKSDNTLNI